MADLTTEQQVQAELERQRAQYQRRQDEDQTRQRQLVADYGQSTEPPKQERPGAVFFLCAFLLALIGDAAELLTAGTFGWFVGLAVDGILLILFHSLQGAKQQIRKLFAIVGLETIPFVNVLPLRAIGIAWLYFQSRSSTAQTIARMTK